MSRTFHRSVLHCFRVPEAKHNLWSVIITSLSNIFFSGRRWNVEKNQVESVPFKADRLFLGTLFFTILLFLLPTTAMYYAVFTVLRLMVLLVKGAINRVINTMNNLPVFPLAVACVKPDLLPGTVCVYHLWYNCRGAWRKALNDFW